MIELRTEISVEELFGPISMPESISWDQLVEKLQQIIRNQTNNHIIVFDSISSDLEISV